MALWAVCTGNGNEDKGKVVWNGVVSIDFCAFLVCNKAFFSKCKDNLAEVWAVMKIFCDWCDRKSHILTSKWSSSCDHKSIRCWRRCGNTVCTYMMHFFTFLLKMLIQI